MVNGVGASFLRFLVIGGMGFLIDAGSTLLLVHFGTSPFLARVPAIAIAMAFTWLANRRFTYGPSGAPQTTEAGRYALVATIMALGNYLVFAALTSLGWPTLPSVIVATGAQTVVSFWAYRQFVFRKSR